MSNKLNLRTFENTLPNKPYCTDELGVTLIRSKSTAITKKHLQVNQLKNRESDNNLPLDNRSCFLTSVIKKLIDGCELNNAK